MDEVLDRIYARYYARKLKNESEAKMANGNKEVTPAAEKAVVCVCAEGEKQAVQKEKTKPVAKPAVKTVKKAHPKEKAKKEPSFHTRPSGVLRLSEQNMAAFGFKAKQELEIVNKKPGEITIKVKG